MFDVLGLGTVAVDFVATTARWPEEGGKIQTRGIQIHDGGLVATALCAVARLGGKACYAAMLGRSAMARRAVESLEKEGVDTSMVVRADGAEPIQSFIIANQQSGQRTIFWSSESVRYPRPEELPAKDWDRRCRVLLVDYLAAEAGIAAAERCRSRGVPVVLDVERETPHVPALRTSCSPRSSPPSTAGRAGSRTCSRRCAARPTRR